MTSLLARVTGRDAQRGMTITTLEDYAAALSQFGVFGDYYQGIQTSLGGNNVEEITSNFVGLAQQACKANGVVFACMLVRASIFSTMRFEFQRLRNNRPSGGFGSPALSIFERPWVGGTTQDLLSRLIQDVDLAGNAFSVRSGAEIVRLRPDWVDIVVEQRIHNGGQLGWRKLGYLYWEGGRQVTAEPVPLMLNEVAHYMPTPDPEASFRGMSWLTPLAREVRADGLMNAHKAKFFENGATPNLIIKHNANAAIEKVLRFNEMLQEGSAGVGNAYKTMNLYPGADATVVGANFQQVDFKAVQGAGETRIAAAAGVPPVIVGLSEGLAAATYSNYGQARRRLADGTAHPLWQNLCGSMEPLLPPGGTPPGTDWRLWYDVSDVPFLREDAGDAANIAQVRATTIKTYIDGGFTPDSAVQAVDTGDLGLLEHTGLFSVQLQPPPSANSVASEPADQPVSATQPTEQPAPANQGA